MALARRSEVAGAAALELGCGLGITAIAALQASSALTVIDCFAEALAYCRYNTLRNAGAEPRTLLADWRTEAGQRLLVAAGPFDLVLAADVLYEPDDVEPLLRLVPRLLHPDGRFWLAEPGRATSARFVAAAQERGWPAAPPIAFEREWPGAAGFAQVTVHRYAGARSPESRVQSPE
jgi:2-polyprenyl-3-methyl-5-hydroxy-6-metoxy-1,4-benzoquinol methylase